MSTAVNVLEGLTPEDFVYGEAHGVTVFLIRKRAERLASSWDTLSGATTYGEFVSALPGHIEDDVVAHLQQSIEYEELPYDVYDADGDIREDLPMDWLDELFWLSDDTLWPRLDSERYGFEVWAALTDALPYAVIDELEAAEAVDFVSTGDGEFLRAGDPETVVRALTGHGSTCSRDQELIGHAAGPSR